MNSVELTCAREALTWQVLGARKLEDVLAAKQALREWIAAHPEDEGMRDGFEQLSHMEDIARERAALPPERIEWYHQHDCLMRQAGRVTTPVEVADALQKIEAWLRLYPTDETLQSTHELLTMMQEDLNDAAAEIPHSLPSAA